MNLFIAQASVADINWWLIAPEVIVCLAAVVVMMVDAFTSHKQRWLTGSISLAGILGAAVSSIWLWRSWLGPTEAFRGMIVSRELRLGFTLIFLFVSALTVSSPSCGFRANNFRPVSSFVIALRNGRNDADGLRRRPGDHISRFGDTVDRDVCARGISPLRPPFYESSLKYFILGSFSSAVSSYGIALTYGATSLPGIGGTTNIAEIANRIKQSHIQACIRRRSNDARWLWIQIATAPFHVWTPDVYEAPQPR